MSKITKLKEKSLKGQALSFAEGVWLISRPDKETFELMAAANEIRQKYKGNKVKLCSIVNAKSGECSENCMFCSQSAHHNTKVDVYPLMSAKEMYASAKDSYKNGSTCFGIVTAGKGVKSDKEIDEICKTIKNINKTMDMDHCTSIGIMSKKHLKKLKDAGLKKFHHNLESSESYFDKMCTTHSFDDRVKTVKAAQEVGLKACCGGIFGIGESLKQRVELALQIKDLDPESVPINFLNPVEGTKAQDIPLMKPLEALRLIAAYRFILPNKDIGVFGGRELVLGSLQPLMFLAGANLTLLGNYLTTGGNTPQADMKMISELGLTVVK